MKTKLFLALTTVCFAITANAQKPFKEIGKDNEVNLLTLSNGQFVEHFTYDTLRQIGSVMFNTVTHKVEYFISQDDLVQQQIVDRAKEASRFMSVDPHENRYPSISPYAFVANNPINATDPNGKDIYLIVWATANGENGHAAIAVSNYRAIESKVIENGKEVTKTSYVKDGSFTYYDLFPAPPGADADNATKNIPAMYQKFDKVSWNGIFNEDPSKSEGRNPDGIVKLTTSYSQDQNVAAALDKRVENNAPYNGVTNNCSDNAECGIEAATGTNINADEQIKTGLSATTPNSLFKATEKLPNATVIKNPGDKVNNGFIEGAEGGIKGKVEQKIMGGKASKPR